VTVSRAELREEQLPQSAARKAARREAKIEARRLAPANRAKTLDQLSRDELLGLAGALLAGWRNRVAASASSASSDPTSAE
jgi:hypothetical protein